MEVRAADAAGRERVEVRGVDLGAVAPEVREAEVVRQHHDDVGRPGRRGRAGGPRALRSRERPSDLPLVARIRPRHARSPFACPTRSIRPRRGSTATRSRPSVRAAGRDERERIAQHRHRGRMHERLQARTGARRPEHDDVVELAEPADEHPDRGRLAPGLGERPERRVAELESARPLRRGDERRVRVARRLHHLVVRQPRSGRGAGRRSFAPRPGARRGPGARAPARRPGTGARAAPGRSRGRRRAGRVGRGAAGAAPPRCRRTPGRRRARRSTRRPRPPRRAAAARQGRPARVRRPDAAP